jgi:peptidoglycan/LPS O-acetylase OafA/YrhL
MTQKNSLLQIYRGLASALVVIHHIASSSIYYLKYTLFFDLFRIGWSGVDFFFVLSGFIITNVHFKDIGNSLKLPSYLLKRLVRIYPTYWIIASISLLVLFLLGKKEINSELISPIYVFKSYLLVPGVYPFVGVAWSLSYEVFFYTIFALLIWKGFRVLWYIGIVYIIIFCLKYFNIYISPELDFLSNGYLVEFLLGSLVALFSQNVRNYDYKRVLMLLGIFLFLSTYIMCYFNYWEKYSLMSRFLFGIASSLIILASLNVNIRHGHRFLVLLGDASFSLYLVHTLVIPLFFKLFASKQFIHYSTNTFIIYAVSIICFIICVMISVLYFWYVEKPMTLYFNKKIKDAYPTNS